MNKVSVKRTPGPWVYAFHDNGFYVFGPDMAMVADGGTDVDGIARMRGVGRGADEQEQEGNAQLIAAAPELLEAAKSIEREISSRFAKGEIGLYDMSAELRAVVLGIRAAIQKAEGAE